MHEDTAPRRKPDPNRVHLALAITFAAAVIAAGVAVGHRPAEAQTGAALDRAAAATPTPAADILRKSRRATRSRLVEIMGRAPS